MAKKKNSGDAPQNPNTTDIQPIEMGLMEDTLPKEAPENQEAPELFKDEARSAIFAKRREMLERENGIAESGLTTIEPINESTAEGVIKEDEQPLPLAASKNADSPLRETKKPTAVDSIPEEPVTEEPPKKYKILVDGQHLEYTIDELQQQAQLGVGARQKFNEAAQLRQQAALDRQQAEQLMFSASQQHSQPQQTVNNQRTQQTTDIPETELRDIAKRLNYGSEEEQVQALKQAGILFSKNTGQANNFTPESIVTAATQNALAAISQSQEQEILKAEFSQIIADPALANATDFIARQLDQKYAALGQPKSRLELLREAGNQTMERYVKAPQSLPNSSVPNAPITVETGNKLERKRAAPQPPASANKVANSQETASYGVPSAQALDAARSKAFQDIARRRGQQVQ